MRILVVLVPDEAGKEGRQLTLERVAGPYYQFVEAGMEVVLCSPDGGAPRVFGDDDQLLADVQRFRLDRAARDAVSDTLAFADVEPDDFDGAYCVGSFGDIWAEPGTPTATLVASFLRSGKPIVVIPGQMQLRPYGSLEGVLILGDGKTSPCRAAKALLGVLATGMSE